MPIRQASSSHNQICFWVLYLYLYLFVKFLGSVSGSICQDVLCKETVKLSNADWCWLMLTDMIIDADKLTYADWDWLMQIDADLCWSMLVDI